MYRIYSHNGKAICVTIHVSELPLVSLARLIDYGCAVDPVFQDMVY